MLAPTGRSGRGCRQEAVGEEAGLVEQCLWSVSSVELLVRVGVQPSVPTNGAEGVASTGLAGVVRSCTSFLLMAFAFPGN